jgi:ribonuclease H / adenosylcobalamin/alpha-ribazole phosphatase
VSVPEPNRQEPEGSQTGPGTTTPSTAHGSVRAPRGSANGDPTTFVVIRHGRTPMTEAGRFSGRGGQDPALSEAGQRDVARAARMVCTLGRPGALFADLPPVDAVITSPLLRTRQTADAVVTEIGRVYGIEPDFTVDEDWIEAGFGIWEGLTYAELVRDHAQELDRWQGSTSYAPRGGDSLDEVTRRVRAARERALAAFPGRTVAVATHATPVRVLIRDALDAGAATMWRTRVGAGSVTVIRYWTDGGIEVVTVNATAHLVRDPVD